MSQYSLIAVVLFFVVATIVMAFCQREETDMNKELNRFGFKVSYVRNWFVFVACIVVVLLPIGVTSNG